METWLRTRLETPVKFLCDNGGEFANMFLEMCENRNIQVNHIVTYYPFSDGLCERNHAVVDKMVPKIMVEQTECPMQSMLKIAFGL